MIYAMVAVTKIVNFHRLSKHLAKIIGNYHATSLHFPSTLPKGVHAAFSRHVLQVEQIIRESGFLFG